MLLFGQRGLWKAAISRTSLSYKRITLTRFTLAFFLLAWINYALQTAVKLITFHEVSQAGRFVTSILDQSPIERGFTVINNGVLQICDNIPGQYGTTCLSVFDAVTQDRAQNNTQIARREFAGGRDGIDLRSRDFSVLPINDPSGGFEGVNVTVAQFGLPETTLSLTCVQALTWLDTFLGQIHGEDIIIIIFQVWLFCLSVIAILAESIPHLLVVVASQALNTAWVSYQVYNNISTRTSFDEVIVNGGCNGVDIMGNLWDIRLRNDIVLVAANAVVLIFTAFLAFQISKAYSNQVLGSVGASPQVNRLYKLALSLYASLQLTSFFIISSSALWFQSVQTVAVQDLLNGNKLYLILFVIVVTLDVPWFTIGVISTRRESRPLFWVFLLLGGTLFAISTALFTRALYRFQYVTWPFFAAITSTGYVLLVISCILAVICRFHFGKGLAHFLWVEKMLEQSGFTPATFAKDPDQVSEREVIPRFSMDEKIFGFPLDEPSSPIKIVLPLHDMV